MNLQDLKKPFPAEDIEFRIGRAGKNDNGVWAMALAYITARAIHDRLDEVCGMDGWQMHYREHRDGTVCAIGIRIARPLGEGEGKPSYLPEWVWKEGGSGATDFEAYKGELSSSEKRAGVPWGIGRYLYNLTESFVETSETKKQGWNYQSKSKDGKTPAFWWKTPDLPEWALPEGTKPTGKGVPQDKPKDEQQETKSEFKTAAYYENEIDQHGTVSSLDKYFTEKKKKAIWKGLGFNEVEYNKVIKYFESVRELYVKSESKQNAILGGELPT